MSVLERQLWLVAVDAASRAPLQGWPLPSRVQPIKRGPEPIQLVALVYPCEGWLWRGESAIETGERRACPRVRVVGETPEGLQVEACDGAYFPDGSWLEAGEVAIVAGSAVVFERPEP